MGKKLLILMIIATEFILTIHSQDKVVYVIAGQGCPANCADEFSPHYPVHLLKINKGKLEKILDIASGNEYVFKIGQYNAFKKIIIYKSSFVGAINNFIVINYNNELKIDTISRMFSEESFSAFTYYIVNHEEGPYLIFEYYPNFNNKFEVKYYYGINLVSKKDTLFDNSIIQYLHSEGEQGIALVESTDDNSEIMKIRTKVIDNKPYYYILYPRLYNQDTVMFNIPKIEELSKLYKYILLPSGDKSFKIVSLINQSLICIYSLSTWDERSLKGNYKFQIYNSYKKNWDYFQFTGCSPSNNRQHNEWLSGFTAYEYDWGFSQKIKKYGSIPGKKFRRDTNMYGTTFDERAMRYKLYPEGVLYIYNINTGKYIEWEALEHGERQGDSEVLNIEDETVYYRINDKIYKAKIINGEKLGKPELLVKDERIPDVHWLFLANE